MLAKEAGYILSLDQASNAAGAMLWKDGEPHSWTVLRSAKKTDPIGMRLAEQVRQLEAWLDEKLGDEQVKIVLFEGVKSKLVLITVGAFTACRHLQHCRLHPRASFVYSKSWKSWAARCGAKGPVLQIKGVKALQEIGWPFDKYPVDSEDVADAAMIYMTWRDKK